jgi:hypothetical protein
MYILLDRDERRKEFASSVEERTTAATPKEPPVTRERTTTSMPATTCTLRLVRTFGMPSPHEAVSRVVSGAAVDTREALFLRAMVGAASHNDQKAATGVAAF